jgi:hypothetical protein
MRTTVFPREESPNPLVVSSVRITGIMLLLLSDQITQIMARQLM